MQSASGPSASASPPCHKTASSATIASSIRRPLRVQEDSNHAFCAPAERNVEILFVRERTNSLTPRLAAYSAEFGRGRMFAALGEVLNFAVIRSDRIQGEGITFKVMPRKSFRRHLEREAMSYKTLIAAVTALAL